MKSLILTFLYFESQSFLFPYSHFLSYSKKVRFQNPCLWRVFGRIENDYILTQFSTNTTFFSVLQLKIPPFLNPKTGYEEGLNHLSPISQFPSHHNTAFQKHQILADFHILLLNVFSSQIQHYVNLSLGLTTTKYNDLHLQFFQILLNVLCSAPLQAVICFLRLPAMFSLPNRHTHASHPN